MNDRSRRNGERREPSFERARDDYERDDDDLRLSAEDRPYREGMPHAKAVGIMRDLAVSGRIDANIVRDVQSVFGG